MVQHANEVRSLLTRLIAVTVLAVLPTSAWAQCAGWRDTAESRMACCAHGDQCPMQSGTDGSATPRATAQADADRCCASSERAPSTQTSTSGSIPITLASAPALVCDVAPLIDLDAWRVFVPIAANPVPRHLLLSVFLV